MNPPDDPDRDRHENGARSVVSTSWTRAARRAYSSPSPDAVPVALSRHAKLAARVCLEYLRHHTNALDAFAARVPVVEISFVSDAEICGLNASYRGKNKPTDVLSFSQIEGAVFQSGGEELALGDVIVSIETAQRQAEELGHDLAHEIVFLVVHGVLHLCGFDHDTATRRRAMWKLQDTIIERMTDEGVSMKKHRRPTLNPHPSTLS
jgi:probable rRNA maturation factor